MAIQAKVGQLTVDIGITDTTILDAPSERHAVSAMSLHNTTSGTAIPVEIYISPDTTSAAGKRVAYYNVAANESTDVGELIGQGLRNTEYVIATASSIGVNVKTTVTTFTAGN